MLCSVLLLSHLGSLGTNLWIWNFFQTLYLVSFKLCLLVVVLSQLYLFRSFLGDIWPFQGHSRVENVKVKVVFLSKFLSDQDQTNCTIVITETITIIGLFVTGVFSGKIINAFPTFKNHNDGLFLGPCLINNIFQTLHNCNLC